MGTAANNKNKNEEIKMCIPIKDWMENEIFLPRKSENVETIRIESAFARDTYFIHLCVYT